jgi:pyruvate dehydrogenase E2 component (dihydrolipoamide acetyltransferase)
MPSLGADMDAGSVLEWCVAPGDPVRRGDVVAVIHTDKNDIDAEAFEDGVIGALLVEPGVEVPVGTPIATIVPSGSSSTESSSTESSSAPPDPEPEPTPEPERVPATASTPAPGAGAAAHEPPVFSPLVRRLVRDGHLDPDRIIGTGPGGSLTRADVEAATAAATAASAATATGAPTSPSAPRPTGPPRRVSPRARRLAAELGIDPNLVTARPGGPVTGDDITTAATSPAATSPTVAAAPVAAAPAAQPAASSPPVGSAPAPDDDRALAMRRRIATLMERSKREIPHYHLIRRIDLTAALTWLSRHNDNRTARERMIPAALLLSAVARAAAEVPGFNGHWRDGAYQPADRVDLGLIVNLRDGGLLVPVIADAAALGAPELMERVHGAVSRARKGRLRSSELGEGTITVSELGDGGADAVFGVIHPPQVALVGFGRPHEVPWAQDGMVGVRTVVDTTLAADHRVSDGHAGSRFLLALDTHLQDPAALEGAPS